jgi:hypothetical protein
MRTGIVILTATVITAICLIVYGSFYNTYKVYDVSVEQKIETPFYDWFKETEVIVGTTFGGIRRTEDGRMVSLANYRPMMHQKLWKFCPT